MMYVQRLFACGRRIRLTSYPYQHRAGPGGFMLRLNSECREFVVPNHYLLDREAGIRFRSYLSLAVCVLPFPSRRLPLEKVATSNGSRWVE
jgi:hypothetical protein